MACRHAGATPSETEVIMNRKKAETIVSVLVFIVGLIIYLEAQKINVGAAMAKGGDFMPKVCAWLLMVAGGLLILTNIAGHFNRAPASDTEMIGTDINYKALFLNLFLLAGYTILLQPIGFILTTTCYVTLQMWLFCPKRKVHLIYCPLTGLISAVVIYYTFVSGFSLMLPAGILG